MSVAEHDKDGSCAKDSCSEHMLASVLAALIDVMHADLLLRDPCARHLGVSFTSAYQCFLRNFVNHNMTLGSLQKAVCMYCIRQTLISAPQVVHVSKNVKQALLTLTDDLTYPDTSDAPGLNKRHRESSSTNSRKGRVSSPAPRDRLSSRIGNAEARLTFYAATLREHVTALHKVNDPTRFAQLVDCLGDIVTISMCRVQQEMSLTSHCITGSGSGRSDSAAQEVVLHQQPMQLRARSESPAARCDTHCCTNGTSPTSEIPALLLSFTSSSSSSPASRVLMQRIHTFAATAADLEGDIALHSDAVQSKSHSPALIPSPCSSPSPPQQMSVQVEQQQRQHDHNEEQHLSRCSSVVHADSVPANCVVSHSRRHDGECYAVSDGVAAVAPDTASPQSYVGRVAQPVCSDSVLSTIIQQMVRHSCQSDTRTATRSSSTESSRARSNSVPRRTKSGVRYATRRAQVCVRRCARGRKAVTRSYVASRKANRYVPVATRGFCDVRLPVDTRGCKKGQR